jgi:hypothetical protein
MDAKIKRKWLKALRSGKYKQGTGALRSDGSYCCLGVLCDVAGAEWVGSEDGDAAAWAGQWSAQDLPASLRIHTGLSWPDTHHLMVMNDECEESFSAIANWIEKNL